MVSDEAVVVAAIAIERDADRQGCDCMFIHDSKYTQSLARAALTAALPHLQAQEWQESEVGNCPKCAADFDGGTVPEEHREQYSPPYRWSRRISIYDRALDRTVAFQCPDCGHQWSRASDLAIASQHREGE